MAKKENRFEMVYTQNGFANTAVILVDRQTGVNYLFCQSGYAGGLTPLLDREGKPVVTAVSSD